MKSLVIGAGQIGEAVTKIISVTDTVTLYDKKGDNEPPILRGIDVMHVCFPCYNQAKFLSAVHTYLGKYNPAHVVVWSTVPIGTTKQIPGAVHSPVEGKHPNLALSISYMRRYIGANTPKEAQWFQGYFQELGLVTRTVKNSDHTEALKLLSTSEYGINIVFANYKKEVAKKLGMDYDLMKDWNSSYNSLYKQLGLDKQFQKYVLDAPDGPIGGHCVVPNAKLLDEQFPSELLKMIKEMT